MSDTDTSQARRTRRRTATRPASITPVFPLLLLETMRDMDRPAEVLEDEDLALSMPRRLGLSDVVGMQIHRFRQEVQHRQSQSDATVEDLIRLVTRRPDAREIFIEAGRRIAWQAWEERSSLLRRSVRVMPRPAALRAARRAARRLFRQVVGPGRLHLSRRPVEMRIAGCITAVADPGGDACEFYSGAFTELLHQYTGRPYRVGHLHCEARGAEICEWAVQIGA